MDGIAPDKALRRIREFHSGAEFPLTLAFFPKGLAFHPLPFRERAGVRVYGINAGSAA